MDRAVTLAGLIEGLGYEVIRVEVAPRGLDVAVGDPMIHDRLTGTSLSAGDVVLAVGVDPGTGDAARDAARGIADLGHDFERERRHSTRDDRHRNADGRLAIRVELRLDRLAIGVQLDARAI